jgi:hypothetical protein
MKEFMPREVVGTYNCPHIYYEEIAISYETEFCNLNNKRCVGRDCEILRQIILKRIGENMKRL